MKPDFENLSEHVCLTLKREAVDDKAVTGGLNGCPRSLVADLNELPLNVCLGSIADPLLN